MSRNYPADIPTQRFLEESFNKERDTRLHWYFKSRKDANGISSGSKQMEVFKRRIEANVPRPSADLLSLKYAREAQDGEQLTHAKPTHSMLDNNLPDMKPLNPAYRDKLGLYNGISHDGQGRIKYLHSRNHHIPETKYNFPVLSSWEYGWGLAAIRKPDDATKPEYARSRIVADSFYNRNGIGLPNNLQRASTTLY